MPQKTRRTIAKYAIAIGVIVAALAMFNGSVGVYTDWLWFDSLDKLHVLQTRLITQVGLWVGSAALVTLVLFVNWFLIPRRALEARVLRIILEVLAALVTVLMASEVSGRWMTLLTFRYAVPFGVSDPIFNLDASFTIFQLPFYLFLVIWAAVLIVVTLIGVALIYLLPNGFAIERRRSTSRRWERSSWRRWPHITSSSDSPCSRRRGERSLA